MRRPYDVVMIADPRLEPPEARALARLARLMAREGWRLGFLSVLGPLAARDRGIAGPLARLLGDGTLRWLGAGAPVRAELALAYHLAPLLGDLATAPRLDCGCAIVRVDLAPPLAAERPALTWPAILGRARALFGCAPVLAPVDAIAAAAIAGFDQAEVAPGFWPPPAPPFVAAQNRLRAGAIRLGSHVGGRRAGRHAGEPAFPIERIADGGGAMAPESRLQELDGFLVERGAAGRPVCLGAAEAEALAAGLPLVAEGGLAPPFAAACVPLADLAGAAGPDRQREMLEDAASALPPLAQALAAEVWLRGLGELVPTLARRRPALFSRRTDQGTARVLMLSPNGVGMGHLTRQLAVARNLPPGVEPIFLSMSPAVEVVRPWGFVGEYLPGPQAAHVAAELWGPDFKARLLDAIATYDARLVLFDGNHPYQALLETIEAVPERPFFWLRRGLWRAAAPAAVAERSAAFDLVVEPGDVARSLDRGATAERGDATRVPPVILLGQGELLPRAAARAALEIPADALAVLVQLGSGNNYDMAVARQAVVDWCLARRNCHVRVASWLIAGESGDRLAGGHRARRLTGFPLSRFVNAFDLAVSACGYNSFHELLAFGVPTVFVPNENPIMDEQEARAAFAERMGLGLMARADDPDRLAWALHALRDPERVDAMRQRMRQLPEAHGARAIGRLVTLHATSWHARRDLPRIPRVLPRH